MADPHAIPITLSQADRSTLTGWKRGRATAQGMALRASIILDCAAPGVSSLSTGKQLGISRLTVGKQRRRFAERGREGLADAPRPGTPRSINDEQVKHVIVTTLQTQPENANHWSTRQLAAHLGMSQNTNI